MVAVAAYQTIVIPTEGRNLLVAGGVGGAGGQQIPPVSLRSRVGMTKVVFALTPVRNDRSYAESLRGLVVAFGVYSLSAT